MADKIEPTEIADADLDVAGGLSPDMKIREAATPAEIDGVRISGIRVGGDQPTSGLRKQGVRANGIRKRG